MDDLDKAVNNLKMKEVEQLSYYSKNFNITTSWDGHKEYTVSVVDSFGRLIDKKETDHLPVHEFNILKTKWIFDYEQILASSRL